MANPLFSKTMKQNKPDLSWITDGSNNLVNDQNINSQKLDEMFSLATEEVNNNPTAQEIIVRSIKFADKYIESRDLSGMEKNIFAIILFVYGMAYEKIKTPDGI